MATNNPHSNNSESEDSDSSEFQGDLSFAGDADIPQKPAARDDELLDNGKTWTPSPRSKPPETPPADDADAVQKTWVPTNNSEPEEPTDAAGNPLIAGVEDTWIPDQELKQDESENVNDTDKTWVPSATPTIHTDNSIAPDTDDPNKTWVPSDTPTHNGIDSGAADADDPNKTWVPSDTPTHNGIDSGAVDADDPNKTWVPSDTPTHSGIEGAPAEAADTDKTWVPDNTPTHHDFSFDKESRNAETGGIDGTVMLEGPPQEQAADPDGTMIFSRTMAMRGMSAEEYEAWQAQVGEKQSSDTVVAEPPVNVTASSEGKRTQIWSKKSSDGLDASLTIRRRPVTGDEQFQSTVKGDAPDYQIVEKLAEGGMGAIYIATQTSLNRELAIKTLKPLRENEKRTYTKQGRISQIVKQRREMFLSEALVTANLVHPHIIPIHDLCETADGSPFYSMKRVHGTPWNERITEMTLEENLEVLHKVCDAVAYAHHNGVVNRDLKPENIMLGEFGEVLVLDWGLAVPAVMEGDKNISSGSASFGAGTPAYMSPELWTGPADAIGTWSDVYLLGAILFEAIVFKPPHEFPEPDSKSGNSGLWKVIDSVVRDNKIRESDVTGELMDIAMKAMHIEPKKRHASVLEFQDAIKGFQRHEESRHLSDRAAGSLAEAREHGHQRGYQDYQTAAALFEEAHAEWPENPAARSGLRETRLAYAELADSKGDFDLGLQIAATEEGEEFTQLTQKMTKARRLRNGLKYATMAAAGIIALVGAISFVQSIKISQQKDEIVALVGTKDQLQQDLKDGEKKVAEADEKVAAADKKVEAANDKLTDANTKVAAAERNLADAKAEVQTVKAEVASARDEVKKAKADVLVAQRDADNATSRAADAMKEAMEADAKAATAVAAVKKAEADIAIAKAEISTAKAEVAHLEVEKVRAGVDLRNADIANLARNSDYASALRQIEQMLVALDKDPEVTKLPLKERERRIWELKQRQQQLQKRTRVTAAPIQTQTISPAGKTVVWGDTEGTLSLWKLATALDDFPEAPQSTLSLDSEISSVMISDDENLIVASAKNVLHLWTPETQEHHTISEHGADITKVVLADGFLLAADKGGSIRSWDLTTRKERWSIRSGSGIRDLAVLPNSNMFLYAGSRGGESADVLAYALPPESAPTSRPQRLGQLRFPRDRNNPPQRITVSPDEKHLLISNGRNGELMILPKRSASDFSGRDRFPFVHAADLSEENATGWVLKEHQRPINDIAFSNNGRRIVTASDDRSIGVWELSESGQLTFTQRLEGHGAKVNAAGFVDTAGNKVLSASADRYCRFWDVENYKNDRRDIQDKFDVSWLRGTQASMEAAPSRYILTGHNRSTAHNPQVKDSDGKPGYVVLNAEHEKQRGAVRSVVLSSDGRRLVTGAADGTAVIWDTQSGQPVTGVSTRGKTAAADGSFDEGHDFNVARLQFLPPNGNLLLTTGFDGNLCLWNADLTQTGAGTQELRIPGLGLVNAVAVSADGKLIITTAASSDSQRSGSAMIWRTDDLLGDTPPTAIATFSGFHQGEVSAVAISPGGDRVATGARDGRIAMWSAATGDFLAGGRVHARNTIVSHVEWLDDDQLMSAGFDGRLRITRAESGSKKKLHVVAKFEHDNIPIERVAFASDRTQFLTVSVRTDKATQKTDYELQLWSPDKPAPLRMIKPAVVGSRPARRIAAVNWSPDDLRVAAAVDGNLQIFDSQTWKITAVLEAPGLGVSDAVFPPQKSADGAEIIATFDGTSAHLWNLKDRSHVADFRPLFAIQATALSLSLIHI